MKELSCKQAVGNPDILVGCCQERMTEDQIDGLKAAKSVICDGRERCGADTQSIL